MSYLATWVLSATVLDTVGVTRPDEAPLGWLAVALILAAFGAPMPPSQQPQTGSPHTHSSGMSLEHSIAGRRFSAS